MDHSRFGPGGYSEEERPVVTGQLDKDAWITSLIDYVNLMKDRCPDARHPPSDWLSARFSMLSVSQGQSATATPEQGSLAAVHHVIRDKMADMQKTLHEHTRRHAANELHSRQVHLNQRDKDRHFRVAAFSNKAA